MPTESANIQAKEAFAIADSFAQVSARILELRLTRDLEPEQARALERSEDYLDAFVVLFRNHGIQLLGKGAAQAKAELTEAVEAARDALDDIAQIKRGLRIAAAVVTLAIALQAGEAKGVVKAIKAVTDAAKEPATA